MKKRLVTGTLLGVLALQLGPVFADNIQMIPPTPLGAMTACPNGLQQMLVYSGSAESEGQAGMNCVPVSVDAQGDIITNGYIQAGGSSTPCSGAIAGAIRFNTTNKNFEGCNGTSWQPIGGGSVGRLYWDGNWAGDHYWCDNGYHVVGIHYDCGCSNNATWFECQAN